METALDKQNMRPEIVENYKGLEPRANVRELLSELLDDAPAN